MPYICEVTTVIDSTRETLILLSDVPPHLPERRGGKRPHVSCIYRWAQCGCRGVKLETLQIGGTSCTSLEAASAVLRSVDRGSNRRATGALHDPSAAGSA